MWLSDKEVRLLPGIGQGKSEFLWKAPSRALDWPASSPESRKSKVRIKGPYYGPLDLLRGGILGTHEGTYGVDSKYARIPGLRAHFRGWWF